ncbi:MAG: hypothetical protein RLZZ200_1540 [Pseudomonadota bacterium]|jgi:predicted pyridoxine 5'-phosphate oxidase superfamily flavin-nucleotide-binding protein
MASLFRPSHRALQKRHDTERLADRIEQRLVADRIDPDQSAFIQSLDMFFLATADADGNPNCSYKGGDPGFVRVVDEHTLMFPNYDGNGMYLSMGNATENPHVGMLFIDFANRKRLRVNGTARLLPADTATPPYPEAQFIVEVTVRKVFPNCPRYIHRVTGSERSEFVPRAGVTTPEPGWKRADWAADVLPRKGD